MNRDEKAASIQDIAENISASDAVFAIDYRGISVSQAADLRRRLRENNASFRVSKNRLAKMAASQVEREELHEYLAGPTALTFVRGDAAAVAKAVTEFSKQHGVLAFKGGLLGSSVLDAQAFNSIATLPSRDALNGQLAGVVASPITGLVRGLNSMVSGLAVALQQVVDQGLVGSGGSEPASAEPEAAAEPEASAEPEAAAEPEASAEPEAAAEPADDTAEVADTSDAGESEDSAAQASDDSNQEQE